MPTGNHTQFKRSLVAGNLTAVAHFNKQLKYNAKWNIITNRIKFKSNMFICSIDFVENI